MAIEAFDDSVMETEQGKQAAPPGQLLEVIANLSRYHREHEKFYSQAPLRQAGDLQAASRALKALADQWSVATASERPAANPYQGSEDLNAPGLVAESGILFMEGEGEPVEIGRLKRDLATVASDCQESGAWLAEAMEHSWQVAAALVPFPQLADLLGERHRIIANDWQAAGISALAGRLIARALELLEPIDFRPASLRDDLSGQRTNPGYLLSASELLDRAADLLADSATLVHDNERRWRTFATRVASLRASVTVAAPHGPP
jgi:hypothetical protein